MSRKNVKTNSGLVALIDDLKAHSRSSGTALWRDVAERLERSNRNWARPNISRLTRYAPTDSVVLVPGKLLGSGEVVGSPTVAAYSFSAQAREKIEQAGGKALTIPQLIETQPDGAGVFILG